MVVWDSEAPSGQLSWFPFCFHTPTLMHVLNHNSVLVFKGFPQQQDGEEKTEGSAQKEPQGLERGAEDKNGGWADTGFREKGHRGIQI